MKLKLYCQSFVIPFLESQGYSRDLYLHEGNHYTQKIVEWLFAMQTNNAEVGFYPEYRRAKMKSAGALRVDYKYEKYNQSLQIVLPDNILPTDNYKNIRVQSCITFKFSLYIKRLIFERFMELMYSHHIPYFFPITKVIETFYAQNFLDEDTFSSQNLRRYWATNKDDARINREYNRLLLRKKHRRATSD